MPGPVCLFVVQEDPQRPEFLTEDGYVYVARGALTAVFEMGTGVPSAIATAISSFVRTGVRTLRIQLSPSPPAT